MSLFEQKLQGLEQTIKYSFCDRSLLQTALTHSSYANEPKHDADHSIQDYERLEFLGDAVLELCVSEFLYKKYNAMNEGMMTRLRAKIVCEGSLAASAKRIHLSNCILLGAGEKNMGGAHKPSILSDTFEAVIGAIFIDGGIEAARAFVLEFTDIDATSDLSRVKDHKSALQEYVQEKHIGVIKYDVLDSTGPEHCKTFTIRVTVDGNELGRGIGKSKQEAGQAAANAALSKLRSE